MNVRAAAPADWPDIRRMFLDFHDAVNLLEPLYPHFSDTYLEKSVEALVESDRGLALVLDAGGRPAGLLLAAAGPSPWLPVLVAEASVLWVDRENRSAAAAAALLDAFEDWVQRIGARMSALASQDARGGLIYQRRGYSAADRRWLKVG